MKKLGGPCLVHERGAASTMIRLLRAAPLTAWAVSVLFVAMALVVAPASAHFDASDKFTHADNAGCASGSHKDPINVVFYTWGTYGRVDSQIRSHAGWVDTGAESQEFADHGYCYDMHDDLADGEGTRNHIRFRGQHSDTSLGWPAWGGVHHEDYVSFPQCLPNGGHAVDANGPNGSGYDQGRALLNQFMYDGGHSYYYAWWGNTQNFEQCDGDLAGSDGYTSYIQLHQVNH